MPQLRQRADLMRRRRRPDIAAGRDGDDAEAGAALLAVAHHVAIALLEDVQPQGHVRKEHHAQREQRDRDSHRDSVYAPWRGPPPGAPDQPVRARSPRSQRGMAASMASGRGLPVTRYARSPLPSAPPPL